MSVIDLHPFEEADQSYTTAIANLDRPIYIAGQVIQSLEPVVSMMSRALYYNRGNVRAAVGNHRDAVADFDAALQHGYDPKRSVLLNRGNSQIALEKFAEAYEDFEAAWSEREGSDAALAMGNCKIMVGEFRDAIQRYIDGSDREPHGSAAHCRANAVQVRRLLEALNGHEYQVKRERGFVYVEAAGVQGLFPFAGNQGNMGNTASGMVGAPGGEGYEGLKGFAVLIGSRPSEEHPPSS